MTQGTPKPLYEDVRNIQYHLYYTKNSNASPTELVHYIHSWHSSAPIHPTRIPRRADTHAYDHDLRRIKRATCIYGYVHAETRTSPRTPDTRRHTRFGDNSDTVAVTPELSLMDLACDMHSLICACRDSDVAKNNSFRCHHTRLGLGYSRRQNY